MQKNEKYYIAYGSNLNIMQMQRRCPGADAVGSGWLGGYRLAFRGSKTGAYLTLTPDPGGRVPVGVWRIRPEHERALDIYEGYPEFYRKEWMSVRVKPFHPEGAPVVGLTGMIYIMDENRPLGVPATQYVETCMIGYDCFGLNAAPLIRAVTEARQMRRKVVSVDE